jgi:hypothetical protein
MFWLAFYLYVGGLPLAVGFVNSVADGRPYKKAAVVAAWPLILPPVFAYAFTAALLGFA